MKRLSQAIEKTGIATSEASTATTSSAEDSEAVPGGKQASAAEAETAQQAACPICHGMGFVSVEVPPDHPHFGRAIPCECTRSAHQARRTADLREASNLHHLSHMTFDTFLPAGQGLPQTKQQNLHHAYELARAFAADPDGWLVLLGSYGCGKTHLAAAIANERLAAGSSAVFVVVPDLLDYLRSAFSPGSEATFDQRFQALRSAPLLILDDLGAQSATSWAQEKLYQLLNHRHAARLPTVITSNHRLDDIELRIRSRLADPALVTMYTILAPDFRLAGVDQAASELSTLRLHSDQTFERFDLRTHELPAEERENLRRVVEYAKRYANHPEGWLVLTGTYGCGKTHLASAVANQCADVGSLSPMFIVAPDLLDHLRATFNPHSQVSFDRRFDTIRTAPLLVLDDLGTESATPWAREKLFQLLNHRYTGRLPTVITTSKSLDEIEKQDPRLASRMLDLTRCTVFTILAPSYRGQTSRGKRGRRA